MKRKQLQWVIWIVVLMIVFSQSLFTLDETETAIITQFGEFIRIVDAPGLHAKIPFIQALHSMDSRVLSADGAPAEFLTRDRKRVLIDYVTRWRIVNPYDFYRRARTELVARARVDEIVGARLRQEVARRDFIDLIREAREDVMSTVASEVQELTREMGIEVIDTRIKRTDLPVEVQDSIFARMNAERHRIAMRYRAEGEEKANTIRADADRQAVIIAAEAYKQSESIRGEGDAQAAEIYAMAYGQDEEFFQFWSRLNAYSRFIGGNTALVVSSDSDLLRYLETAGTP